MPGPLTAAGATPEPTEYACLSQDRHFTGLWTQRSPFRDADVPYLYNKFYQAGRFDSLIDGLNREITGRLTSARRPGISAYGNAASFKYAAVNSFYSFKNLQNFQQVLQLVIDCTDGNVYDGTTAGSRTTIFAKTGGTSAAKMRFLGLPGGAPAGNYGTLYFTNGTDIKKALYRAGGYSVYDWTPAAPTNPPGLAGSGSGGTYFYGYAYQALALDGSVTTGSPVASIPVTPGTTVVTVTGDRSIQPQIDTVMIFRGVLGSSSPLLLLGTVANAGAGSWTFTDTHTPDTSLNAFILMPQNGANNPPPPGFTAPEYHCGRIWGIVGNRLVYSGGPDTLTGNGNTAWPAKNFIPLQEQGIRLWSHVSNQGPTLYIWGMSNVYAVFGDGTIANPFSPAVMYMRNVGILNYDAVTMVGSTFYAYTSTYKLVSFDPSAGHVDIGFPIADQFVQFTVGGGSGFYLYFDPATTSVTWHQGYGTPGLAGGLGAGDTGLFVVGGPGLSEDMSGVWFRLSLAASPESGLVWSPPAILASSGSAIQSVETAPGKFQLLVGPVAAGSPGTETNPIGFRDYSTSADLGVGYSSWQVLGNIVMCQSGEIAEIAHIALKSAAVGARPTVSLLLGEIKASTQTPWNPLQITGNDPPDLPASLTYYSDRYTAMQNGVCPKCDNFQLKIDFGSQNVADELFMFSVYGAKHSERRQQ